MALHVGLVWGGNPAHSNDHLRSVPLSALAPLADLSGVQYVVLQKGPAAKQIPGSWAEARATHWTSELTDFAETAALIRALDVIVTVDTSVAHVSGALGARVWTAVHVEADWRWLRDRTDSPWYPTMRLFRQTRQDVWDDTVLKIASELRQLVSQC
jgi:ADP-heptose:LPS heptosyltransferase